MGRDSHSESRWEHTIPELFAVQVRERPDDVAVSCSGEHVSYAELDERTDRIAAWLATHDVGTEDVVAVQLERGHDLVAALLGIAKAGAVYLSLEPGAPQARLEEVIAAAGAVALVTGEEGPDVGLSTLRLPDGLGEADPDLAQADVHPDNLAYISFTSGSTGRPKGVGVPHRAVARLVGGDYAEFGPGQVFLLLAPVSFDASTFEIWGPLLTGGRLAVYPPGQVVAEELARVLEDEEVTTLFLTTALFHRMVDHHLDAFAGLTQLLAGGETVDPSRFNRFVEELPSVRLIHAYGPTENTTFSTCNLIPEPVQTSYVPMGRPITGTEIRVLSPDLTPVEHGDRGELCVAGAGLSRGYVTDARATAASFVPDPFAAAPGGRMYRTGDLVRVAGEDDLQFLGRADRQVKIGGFRVEPAEVERALGALDRVRDAVVVVRRSDGGDKSLIGYVVPELASDEEPAQLAAQIRRELREVLPPYMIPWALVPVDELPLKPNGKVDTAALPALERGVRESDGEFVAPRTPTEQLVSDLWAEALNLDRVGVLDDFFELGGNSLLAMDLITGMEIVFDVELPVRTLLLHPTVEEFAAAVDDLLTPQERDEDHHTASVGARAAG